jgi:hypothetical protein
MKNISLISISFAVLLSICSSPQAQAQTEGFNVKTPVQTISDGSSEFINGIAAEAKADPKTSIPRELLCRAECILVLPSVQTASGRDDFEGTGLLGCLRAGSGDLAPPIFFRITNIESFNENGGGLIILVTDRKGVKSILGDQLQLNPQNAGTGGIGPQADLSSLKPFIAYAKPAGGGIKAFDASGSTLVYDSGDTFNAYQQDLDPVDIMLFGIDVPPALRGFKNALETWRGACK